MQNILVTGAGGFVGCHMIDALLKRRMKVRALDNFSCSSRKSFIKDYSKKVDLVECDIRNPRDVKKSVRGMDAVFHFAAIRSVVKTVEDPLLSHEVNATGALLLLHHSREARVKHFVFTSTSAVYGDALADAQKESGRLNPISPYGMAKLLAERYAKYYYFESGLPTTSVRIFNVYGPRQNPESKYSLAVPGILSKIYNNERPVVDGSGGQSRDFVYIADVLDAFFKILGNKKAYGKVYNLGFGRATAINTLVKTLIRLTGTKLKPIHGPRRPGDPDRTCADVSLIRRELGWAPKTSLEKGLEKVVRNWKESVVKG